MTVLKVASTKRKCIYKSLENILNKKIRELSLSFDTRHENSALRESLVL